MNIMLKRTIVAASVAALSFAAVSAQESATFTLRSGERISGQLVDLSGSGFQVRVNGQDGELIRSADRSTELRATGGLKLSGVRMAGFKGWVSAGVSQHVARWATGQKTTRTACAGRCGRVSDKSPDTQIFVTAGADVAVF
jgi:hypothetical protein